MALGVLSDATATKQGICWKRGGRLDTPQKSGCAAGKLSEGLEALEASAEQDGQQPLWGANVLVPNVSLLLPLQNWKRPLGSFPKQRSWFSC